MPNDHNPATEIDHRIEVRGRWHNDNTAGVSVWCETCDVSVIDSDDHGDVLTPEQIALAVAEHTTPLGEPSKEVGA